MKNVLDLKNDSISKLLLNYLVPSVTGMLIISLHVIIEGIFVGRGVGSDGLAAINIVVPFFSLFAAIGFLIGLGGSTIVSIKFGEGKPEDASNIFTQSMLLAVIIIVLITIFGELNIEKLSCILGANDKILPLVKSYMRVLLYFAPVLVLTDALSCFVRNDKSPKLSMYAMIIGALVNCIFEYIFIFRLNLGINGAALGIGIGNALSLLMLLMHFILKKGELSFVKPKFVLTDIIRVFSNGLPNFLTEMSLAVVTLAFNLFFMKIAGELGVSSYSIVNYIHTLMLLVFIGIGQAAQPIISYNYGAKEYKRVQKCYVLCLSLSVVFGVVFFITGILFGKNMVELFNKNDMELMKLTIIGIKIYFISYLFMGANMATAAYFQSIEKPKLSTIVSLCRGLIFIMVGLLILPRILNVNGIWLTTPLAELLTFIICCMLLINQKNKNKQVILNN